MNKIYDAIMGLVAADALGVPAEFKPRDTYEIREMTGYGTHHQPPGTWSDDSSMTLATVDSLICSKKLDPYHLMHNFWKWLKEGEFTPYGEVFDAGGTTIQALRRYTLYERPDQWGGRKISDNGSGALMRILPIALVNEDIAAAAELTHSHIISTCGCRIYGAVVKNLLQGLDKKEAVLQGINQFEDEIHHNPQLACYRQLPELETRSRSSIKSSGYVVDILEAALWCFLKGEDYRSTVLMAVNLGEDTDTVAAVAGGLAGLYYGTGEETGIPEEWIAQIPRREWIRELCDKLNQEYPAE